MPNQPMNINLTFLEILLVQKGRGLDEAYKGFIMLTCALLYSAVLLGPWGWIKQWANMGTLGHWILYAAGFIAINLALVPGLFWLAAFAIERFFEASFETIIGKQLEGNFVLR